MTLPAETEFVKNSTLVTEPPGSGSEAVALIVPVQGAAKAAPLAGFVMLTLGGWLAEATMTEPAISEGCMVQL